MPNVPAPAHGPVENAIQGQGVPIYDPAHNENAVVVPPAQEVQNSQTISFPIEE